MNTSIETVVAPLAKFAFNQTLEQALEAAKSYLRIWAMNDDFAGKMNLPFGSNFDALAATSLAKDWAGGDFSKLPEIEIRNGSEINGAKGAFARTNNTIYLSQEFLIQNISNSRKIADVLLEEIGHFVDARINSSDAAGDEGAIFASLVRRVQLDNLTLQSLKAEDDSVVLTLDGQIIQIEQNNNPKVTEVINGLNYLNQLLGNIQSTITESQIFASKLPLLGDKLSSDSATQFIGNLRTRIGTAQSKLSEINDLTLDQVQQTLSKELGEYALVDPINNNEVKVNLNLSKKPETPITAQLATGLGLSPGFGLNVNGSANVDFDFNLNLGFGVNKDQGFFVNTSATNKEFSIDLNSSLNLNADAELGFLKLKVEDKPQDLNGDSKPDPSIDAKFSIDLKDLSGTDGKLTLQELSSANFGSLIDPKLNASANINLHGETNFGSSAVLPAVNFDFKLGWHDIFSSNSKPTIVAFNDMNLNLGSFFQNFAQPVLQNVNKVIDPVRPLLKGLTANIDFLTNEFPKGLNARNLLDIETEVTPGKVTLLDVLKGIDKYGKPFGYSIPGIDESLKFIKAAQDVDRLINLASSSTSGNLPLGNLDLSNVDVLASNFSLKNVDLDFIADTNSNLQNSSAINFINNGFTASPGGGFDFPILTNPQKAFEFLVGKPDVVLFTYDMPALKFGLNQIYVPIPTPVPLLYVKLGLEKFEAAMDFAFGYDTHGIDDFSGGSVFNGFYVSDTDNPNGLPGKDIDEVSLTGEFGAKLSLDAEVIELSGGGFLGIESGFNLNDVDKDGKVRINEIEQGLFDKITGEIYAYLGAKAELPVGLAFVKNMVTNPVGVVGGLVNNLASEVGWIGEAGEFVGKTAKRAVKKVVGWLPFGDEIFDWVEETFTDDSKPDNVLFEIKSPRVTLWKDTFTFGSGDTGSGEKAPLLAGLEGNQWWLNMGPRAPLRLNVDTKDGDEVFTVEHLSGSTVRISAFGVTQEKAGVGTINADGGAGNDAIYIKGDVAAFLAGGLGNDELYGGSQNDTLKGGDQDDYLEGGSGIDQIYGEGGKDRIKGGADADYLNGGAENDLLYGEGGEDSLYGDLGNDYLNGGSENDLLYGEVGDDRLYGDLGNDYLNGGSENDRLYGEGGEDSLYGDLGNDYLNGGSENDQLYGEGGEDQIFGDLGNDYLDGGSENDQLFGETGLDTLKGGAGDDFLNGASENDQLHGETGADILKGGAGDDFLDGGSENDQLFGEAGVDTLALSR
jgi:Ca2+-binding RTX toxin-like protein